MINEVADKGSTGVCDIKGWVELWNYGNLRVNLSDLILHNDKGYVDNDAYSLGPTYSIDPDEYLILCQGSSFKFNIGESDTINLTSSTGYLVATTGRLGWDVDNKDGTFSRTDSGTYIKTRIPTPGAQNQFDGNSLILVFPK